jgi:DNA invertase Pin-like site-specific DNA recombinase
MSIAQDKPLCAILWCAVSTAGQAADDKDSLPTQEADARSLCEREGWRIADVLRVPGHSRRYIDIHECARDMRLEGIDAFDKLIRHWEAGDFDVLLVRDASRFARTQALHAYVVERTIDSGARIFSLQDGFIDETNYRMWIAMGGYSAAGEIDNLKKKRQIGFDARARRGLPVNAKVVASHKLLRDEKTGKALKVVIDGDKRQ